MPVMAPVNLGHPVRLRPRARLIAHADVSSESQPLPGECYRPLSPNPQPLNRSGTPAASRTAADPIEGEIGGHRGRFLLEPSLLHEELLVGPHRKSLDGGNRNGDTVTDTSSVRRCARRQISRRG